jgi:hypothetical protein
VGDKVLSKDLPLVERARLKNNLPRRSDLGPDRVGIIVIKKQAMAAPPGTSWEDVKVEEGSPWSIRIETSVMMSYTVRDISPIPKVRLSVVMSGKPVDVAADLDDLGLLVPVWETNLKSAVLSCIGHLFKRSVPIPYEFQELLLASLREARIRSILLMVRHQAASLIHHIPSSEACRIWCEEEIINVMSSMVFLWIGFGYVLDHLLSYTC